MDLALHKDIQTVVKKLEAVKMIFGDADYEKILADAGEVARDAMQKEAPGSGYTHVMKDGGGRTKRVRSGNLKRSIQVFKSKKSKRLSALVGPVTSKKSKITKLKGGPKVSKAKRAFYWRFVYYGAYNAAPNRFIDRARSQTVNGVLRTLKSGTKKYLNKEISQIFR